MAAKTREVVGSRAEGMCSRSAVSTLQLEVLEVLDAKPWIKVEAVVRLEASMRALESWKRAQCRLPKQYSLQQASAP